MKPVQLGEARAFLTAAAALRPESAGAHLNVGLVLEKSGDLAGAMDRARKAMELKPDYAEAWTNWTNRGVVYYRLRQYDKAIADFSKPSS
jgi:tetratricopeptide (TPR) repeat protein